MAFRKKADYILAHKPDILLITECEHPDKLILPVGTPKPTDTLWFGKNRNKGLALFSYSSYRFKVLDIHNENFQMIIPVAVTGGSFDFNLFAIGHIIQLTWMGSILRKFGKQLIFTTNYLRNIQQYLLAISTVIQFGIIKNID